MDALINGSDVAQSIFTIAERDIEILKHLAGGRTVKEISKLLYISPAAITSRVNSMRLKADATNVTHLIAIKIREGVI